ISEVNSRPKVPPGVTRFQPQLRFLWERVTPGGTFGLEFTSLMAVLAVSGFILLAYTGIVSGEPRPPPGGTPAIGVAEPPRVGWLTDAAKVFTQLGSSPLTGLLALLAAALLVARRRWAELCVLVGGVVLIVLGAHEIKAAVDRPRP